jgi:Tol biopolymer transport system component
VSYPSLLRLLLVALGAGVVALLLASGSSSHSGAAESLVFARGGEIFTRAPSGMLHRLTRNRVFDGFPAWSPDHASIVFVRSVAASDADVWVMNADGSGARRLAGSARNAQDLYPAFSPDGRWIVFSSTRGDREPDLYVMGADGTKLRRLVAGPRFVIDTQPRFSPDGRHVIFTANRPAFFNHELYRVRFRDGGGLTRLTFWGSGKDGARGDDISPSYSPDGTQIAFVSDRQGGYAIWTMNARGGDLQQVVRHAGHNVVFPRFSPDGRSLAYTSFPENSGMPERLWLVRIDGSGRRSLGLGGAADW